MFLIMSPSGKICGLKSSDPKIDPCGTPQVILDDLGTVFSVDTMNSLSEW